MQSSFDFTMKNVHVKANFNNRVCLLMDESGAGKSYFLSCLFEHLRDNIPIAFVDYSIFNFGSEDVRDKVLRLTDGKSVVLLDNADLYADSDLISRISGRVDLLIVCSVTDIISSGGDIDVGDYYITYDGKELLVSKWGIKWGTC